MPATGTARWSSSRLGLRLFAGLPEAEALAILAARQARNGAPFASVEEAALRARVGRRALKALAGADAYAGTGVSRRRAGWAARGVASGPQDLPLFTVAAGTEAAALAGQAPLVPELAATLPAQPRARHWSRTTWPPARRSDATRWRCCGLPWRRWAAPTPGS